MLSALELHLLFVLIQLKLKLSLQCVIRVLKNALFFQHLLPLQPETDKQIILSIIVISERKKLYPV